jgi:hypothetical protein
MIKEGVIHNKPEFLLFDLGGVLVEFTGIHDMMPMLRVPLSEIDLLQRWTSCPTLRAFERRIDTWLRYPMENRMTKRN